MTKYEIGDTFIAPYGRSVVVIDVRPNRDFTYYTLKDTKSEKTWIVGEKALSNYKGADDGNKDS